MKTIISSIRVSSGPSLRSKPKAGDRRTTKRHGLQIRVQCMARDWITGRPIGRIVRDGRPVFAWRRLADLDRWDHYLLTADERQQIGLGQEGGAA